MMMIRTRRVLDTDMSVTFQRGGSGAKAHQFALCKPRDGDMVQALMSNAIDATLPNVSEAVPQVADGSFIGILTALHERQRSGRGQWVHTSLLEAMVFMLDFQAARWLIDNEVPTQAGNHHPTSTPTGVFETSDGHINIAVGGQRMWQRFCEALDEPGMHDNPDYASNALRLAHRDRLAAEINAITSTRDSASWIQRFTEAGVPSGEILSIDDVFAHPQVVHLGLAAPMESATRGLMHVVAQPVTLHRTPSRVASPTPERGEHSGEILAELGYSADEISALREQSIV